MAKQNKKGGGSRKVGRNKKWCEAYRMRQQREINLTRKLAAHLRRNPADNRIRERLKSLIPLFGKRAGIGLIPVENADG